MNVKRKGFRAVSSLLAALISVSGMSVVSFADADSALASVKNSSEYQSALTQIQNAKGDVTAFDAEVLDMVQTEASAGEEDADILSEMRELLSSQDFINGFLPEVDTSSITLALDTPYAIFTDSNSFCYPGMPWVYDCVPILTCDLGTFEGELSHYEAGTRYYIFDGLSGVPSTATLTLDSDIVVSDSTSYKFVNMETGAVSTSLSYSKSDFSPLGEAGELGYMLAATASTAPDGLCSLVVTNNADNTASDIIFRDKMFAVNTITDATVKVDGVDYDAHVAEDAIFFTVPTKWNGSWFDYSNTIEMGIFGIDDKTYEAFEGSATLDVPSNGLSASSNHFDAYLNFGLETLYNEENEESSTPQEDDDEDYDTEPEIVKELEVDLDTGDIIAQPSGGDTHSPVDPDTPASNVDPSNPGKEGVVVSGDASFVFTITSNLDKYNTQFGTVNTLLSLVDATTNKLCATIDVSKSGKKTVSVPAGDYKLLADTSLSVVKQGTLKGVANTTTNIELTVEPRFTLALSAASGVVSCSINDTVLAGQKNYNIVLTADKQYKVIDYNTNEQHTVTATIAQPKVELILGGKVAPNNNNTVSPNGNVPEDVPNTVETPLNGIQITLIVVVGIFIASIIPVYIINRKKKN